MIDANTWVIVPVRSFTGAKSRLAPLLTAPERATLGQTMLGDVLGALAGVAGLRHVAIVTGADEVADHARQSGLVVIDDHGASSTNAAIKVGLIDVARRRGGPVLVLPSDVPCVRSVDIEALLMASKKSGVALAPALHDGGTNALACDVPARIPPCFGPDSFNRHVRAANQAGLRPVVLMNGRLGRDLDEPAQLVEFLAMQTETRSDAYLRSLRLADRLTGMVQACGSLAAAVVGNGSGRPRASLTY